MKIQNFLNHIWIQHEKIQTSTNMPSIGKVILKIKHDEFWDNSKLKPFY